MPPKPTPRPDLADKIAEALRSARLKAQQASQPFTVKEAAQIIRVMLVDALQPDSKASPGPFGDRKAIPPSPGQVEAYAASICFILDGQYFCDSYQAKGWMVGRVKMKDWQAAVRTWRKNSPSTTKPSTPKDYASL